MVGEAHCVLEDKVSFSVFCGNLFKVNTWPGYSF